ICEDEAQLDLGACSSLFGQLSEAGITEVWITLPASSAEEFHQFAANSMKGCIAELATWRRWDQAEHGAAEPHDRMGSAEKGCPFFIESHFLLHGVCPY